MNWLGRVFKVIVGRYEGSVTVVLQEPCENETIVEALVFVVSDNKIKKVFKGITNIRLLPNKCVYTEIPYSEFKDYITVMLRDGRFSYMYQCDGIKRYLNLLDSLNDAVKEYRMTDLLKGMVEITESGTPKESVEERGGLNYVTLPKSRGGSQSFNMVLDLLNGTVSASNDRGNEDSLKAEDVEGCKSPLVENRRSSGNSKISLGEMERRVLEISKNQECILRYHLSEEATNLVIKELQDEKVYFLEMMRERLDEICRNSGVVVGK